ncbi:MAG: hypothetical protein WBX15_12000 [Thermoanaerobaculia bacterium]
MLFRRTLVLFSAVLLVAAVASAASPDLSGSIRLRLEEWNWFDTPAANDHYLFGASTIHLAANWKLPKSQWTIEVTQPTLAGLPEDSIAAPPAGQLGLGATYYAANHHTTAAGLFVSQAFARFDHLAGIDNSLQLGRFTMIEGVEGPSPNPILGAVRKARIAHRLIGNFGFSHVGRSFDGARYTQRDGDLSWNLFAGRPTAGVFIVNGMPERLGARPSLVLSSLQLCDW